MSLPPLPPALARALQTRGYSELTPVQLAVLQPDAQRRDLLVSAKTGSGKTVAYGLAFAPDLLIGEEGLAPPGDPLALVVAPTRELALQVQRELEWLFGPAGGRVTSCVGGMDPRREQRALAAGVHIVVGTPGRLRDHLERGQLSLAAVRVIVLDEADEMLDLGFREELEALLDAAPSDRRTLLFSATLPKPIVALAKTHQTDALRITVAGDEPGHGDIDYRAIRIAPSDVEHAVVNLLRYFEAGAALVFCSTREAVRRLHANLVERGFSVVALSGELTQSERTHALQALRDRRARVCVATDVAARGIDIPDLELVIHAELPIDAAVMQHRSGRTGRAGRKGVSAVLVPHPRRRRAESLFKAAALEVSWTSPPSAEDVRARDQERLAVQLRPSGDASEEDLAVARALLAEASPERVVAGLVRASRASLPAPEDLVDAEPEAPLRPAARPGFEDTVWFSIDIGRTKNADPKWLLPLICRRGHVTKRDIGAIRVFDRETRFEIVRPLAERFLAAADKGAEEGGRIQVLTDPESPPPHDRKPFRRPKPDFAARAPETPGPGFPGASERTADRGERAFLERPASPAPPRGQGRGPAAAKPPRPHTSKRQAAKSGGRPDGRRPPRS